MIKLFCDADMSDGFELALKQLDYQIIDSNWDDENNKMYYKVVKGGKFMTKQIETLKIDVEELKKDLYYVKNQSSVDALQYQIRVKEQAILEMENI
ncbi:hypothetical protein [Bacillus safensis]|uniref:hypothetical protein n=1 Tax=Bacillus safensis TaxID=561879 RepID=UPI0030000169